MPDLRRRGLSVRWKLTLSYVGFLMVAWVGFLVVLVFVLHYVPDVNLLVADTGRFAPNRSDLMVEAVPVMVAGTITMVVVGLGGGWVLAGQMLQPLAAISAAAREAGRGSLSHRIALEGPDDEFRRLADVFDDMLASLEGAFDEQRRFASNASHELRTPHAVTRTMLEVARADVEGRDVDRLIGRLQEMNERSIRTLEALLVLSRVPPDGVAGEPCDLGEVVRAALPGLADEVGRPDLLLIDQVVTVPVTGDHGLLGLLVTNLVVNAHRHNATDDGFVRVATGRDAAGRGFLEVENGGEMIDPDVVPTLVEPFVRGRGRVRAGDGSAGSGLGLTLVAAIARAHRAELTLRARPQGGLVVTMTLAEPGVTQ